MYKKNLRGISKQKNLIFSYEINVVQAQMHLWLLKYKSKSGGSRDLGQGVDIARYLFPSVNGQSLVYDPFLFMD